MITKDNYLEEIKRVGLNKLPDELKQAHEVIMVKTDQGANWALAESDDEFKKLCTLTFKKLHEFISSIGKGLKGIERAEDISSSEDSQDEKQVKSSKAKPEISGIEVRLIQRFLDFHDKVLYKKTFEIFIEEIQDAIKKKQISKKSVSAKEIMLMQEACIKAFNSMKQATHFVLKPETIKKLKRLLVRYEDQHDDSPKSPKKKKVDLSGISPEGRIMSSTDFARMQFNSLGFKDKWLNLIGDPAPGFTAMVFGKPKMGKSYLCVDFAGYLARNHGKVLYVAKEEKLDLTLQEKLKAKNVEHDNLIVSDYLPKKLLEYDFIFLDSVNKLRLTPQDLEKLKKENPKKSFIFIFQTTKDGNFRGANEFQHDVDVVIEVPEIGKATQFGRFNQGGEINIFPENRNGEENEDVELSGIKKGAKEKFPAWTRPKHLSKGDHFALQEIYKLYKAGDMREAMNYAMNNADTMIREEIPGDIWKKMGGQLTPTGVEKLKRKKSGKSAEKDESPPVEIEKPKVKKEYNPAEEPEVYQSAEQRYAPAGYKESEIFSLTPTNYLSLMVRGVLDVNLLIRQEMTNRGLDENGDWVGLDKAREIHKV